jgi:hypothetical protein
MIIMQIRLFFAPYLKQLNLYSRDKLLLLEAYKIVWKLSWTSQWHATSCTKFAALSLAAKATYIIALDKLAKNSTVLTKFKDYWHSHFCRTFSVICTRMFFTLNVRYYFRLRNIGFAAPSTSLDFKKCPIILPGVVLFSCLDGSSNVDQNVNKWISTNQFHHFFWSLDSEILLMAYFLNICLN